MTICPALQDVGITNQDSQEAIDFCTKSGSWALVGGCPHSKCFHDNEPEPGEITTVVMVKRKARKCEALRLIEKGLSVEDIAKRIGVSRRTVERYLR